VEVRLSTRGRTGRISRTVEVLSNDPETPRLTLGVSALAEPIAEFEPRFVKLGKVKKGTAEKILTTIVGRDAWKIRIESISVRDPRVLKVETIGGEGPPVLQVTFFAGEKIRSFSERVTVRTNLVTPESLEFFVSGQVTEDLVTDRDYVILEPPGKGRDTVGKVRVFSLSGKPFRVTGVEDPSGAVSGALSKEENGWSVLLRLARLNNTVRGGRLRIRTDRKDQENLYVHFGVRVPPHAFSPATDPARRPINAAGSSPLNPAR